MPVGASVEPKGGKMLDKAIAGSFSQLEVALVSTHMFSYIRDKTLKLRKN